MSSIVTTPQPPYYAVIFTTVSTGEAAGYSEMAGRMLALASQQPGFLGLETAHEEIGISVSYWETLESIAAWRDNMMHRQAQAKAKDWYGSLRVRVCRVEREYGF